jgi:hypothetical protein
MRDKRERDETETKQRREPKQRKNSERTTKRGAFVRWLSAAESDKLDTLKKDREEYEIETKKQARLMRKR